MRLVCYALLKSCFAKSVLIKKKFTRCNLFLYVNKQRVMVGFKNRYMVVEVNLNPNRDLATDDPIILTQYNVMKAIRDSILVNFGECGLAASVGSLQGNPNKHLY